ncbi:MAG TPA: NADH-quinone oxidoreductase subunit N [Steroidobacteraceae bacterium]
MNWHDVFTAMLPEHILLAGLVLLLLVEIVNGENRDGFFLAFVTVAAATVAACTLYSQGYAGSPFAGHFLVAPATSLPKAVILALTLPILLISRDDFTETRYYALLVSSLYGACLIISSSSFLTLFLGIELMSLPVYVLVLLAFLRPESTEAALKYLVLGGAATATLLMGVSLLYGASGSLEISTFAGALSAAEPLAATGAVLVVVALMLKAAIVPFHAWAPDAYEGASVPVTAYMATVIKAGALFAALRLFAASPVTQPMIGLLAVLPLISMIWGNVAAIRQTSFRRMIAYSSIAHAGYLFYGFLGAGPGRYEAITFYLVVYGVMNVLAFVALPRSVDDARGDQLDALKGLFQRQPVAALVIAAAMLSLAGLPPLPGFAAKFLVFRNVLAAGYTGYAVLGLLASYLGIYFYLRVIQYMFMSAEEPAASRGKPRRLALLATVLCVVPAILLSFFPGWLLERL